MKKLNEFQVENLIETMVNDRKNRSKKILLEYYINKWNNCRTKKEKFKFFDDFFAVRRKMLNEGYNNYYIHEGLFGDLFSSGTRGFKEMIKEWLVKKLLKALGVEDPGLKQAIAIGLSNISWSQNLTKFLSPLKNCRFFSNAIMDGVIEYYGREKMSDWVGVGGGMIGDTFANAIFNALNDSSLVQPIQDSIGNAVCTAIEQAFGGKQMDFGSMASNLFGGGKQTPAAATE